MTSDAREQPTIDEVHITLEQFEDEITYEPDGTAVLFGIHHRCPTGTPCRNVTEAGRATMRGQE